MSDAAMLYCTMPLLSKPWESQWLTKRTEVVRLDIKQFNPDVKELKQTVHMESCPKLV
jgi:hypothetical protein